MRFLPYRQPCCLPALAVLLLVGCESNHYKIKMEAVDNGLSREITCWREHTSQNSRKIVEFPVDELKDLASSYDATPKGPAAARHTFAGVFVKDLPVDVGGSGSYTHWESPLGSVSAYVERFRGDDDLLSDVQRRQAAADRFTDLLIAWFSAELAEAEGFPKLNEFMDNEFRHDLKNISLYFWAAGVVNDPDEVEKSGVEWIVRVGQYLVERDYFSPEQIPIIVRAAQDGESAPAIAIIDRFLATKMGLAEDRRDSFRFLADLEHANTSFDKFARGTDEYQQLLAEWEKEKKDNPDVEAPNPGDIFANAFMSALLPGFSLGRADRLSVTLKSPTKPFATNGTWDEADSQLQWKRELLDVDSENVEFPKLLFAIWSDPNAQTQTKRFGSVVLEDEALAQYCVWYKGLTEDEAKQWNEFVANLEPGDGLVDRLGEFRFATDQPVGDDDADLASMARELIIRALTPEDK